MPENVTAGTLIETSSLLTNTHTDTFDERLDPEQNSSLKLVMFGEMLSALKNIDYTKVAKTVGWSGLFTGSLAMFVGNLLFLVPTSANLPIKLIIGGGATDVLALVSLGLYAVSKQESSTQITMPTP